MYSEFQPLRSWTEPRGRVCPATGSELPDLPQTDELGTFGSVRETIHESRRMIGAMSSILPELLRSGAVTLSQLGFDLPTNVGQIHDAIDDLERKLRTWEADYRTMESWVDNHCSLAIDLDTARF